jgi:hypothetical protein
MTLYKVSLTKSSPAISKHKYFENAKIARRKLVSQGRFGYRIYVWSKTENMWINLKVGKTY